MGTLAEEALEKYGKKTRKSTPKAKASPGTPLQRVCLDNRSMSTVQHLTKMCLSEGMYIAFGSAGNGGVLAITIMRSQEWALKAYIKDQEQMDTLLAKTITLIYERRFTRQVGEQIYLTIAGKQVMAWEPLSTSR